MTISTPASTMPQTQSIRQATRSRTRQLVLGVALGAVILLGAFLRFYKLGAYNIGNGYYAATVQSMLTSWHNFFFAAFEPGGSVTVDKPPLGFWVQAISAVIFGVNGFALALPQALAGVLSIPLLYLLVKRHFGAWAGLLAALALAVTPVTVATERNNTIDGLLLFVLLLAAWAFLNAVRSGRLRDVLLGAVLVGLGFNIKMLQAVLPLPAFYLLYVLGAPHPVLKRFWHLALATVVLVAVSLSWAVAVDLVPAENRPFIGSSTTNSVIELVIGHNGLRRLGLDRLFASAQSGDGPTPPNAGPPPPAQPPGGQPPQQPGHRPPGSPPGDGGPGAPAQGGGQPGFQSEVGSPGWQRLFDAPLADEASWLLPLALAGLALAAITLGKPWPLTDRHLALVLWAGWLLPELAYFSFTSGLFHAYYLLMLGPPMAALVGAGAWALARLCRQRRWIGWTLATLVLGGTLAFQAVILREQPAYAMAVIIVGVLALLTGLGSLAALRRGARLSTVRAALSVALLGVLAGPLLWSGLTALDANPNVHLPNAGPQTGDQNRPPTDSEAQVDLIDILLEHTDPDTYLLATLDANQAAPYILATKRPVLTLGGFNGSDDLIDAAGLAEMVAQGDLRFVMAMGVDRQKPDIAAWLEQACTLVHLEGQAIYDCAGR